MNKQRLLIVCQGNACVSIMAEALFKKLGRGFFDAQSGGSAPAGFIHPQTIAVLRRHGLGTDQLRSKSWNEFSTQRFDLIITVCDQTRHEPYPLFPGRPEKIFWNIPNPLQYAPGETETEAAIEQAYLLLKKRVENLCHQQRARMASYPEEQAAAG